jgi:polyhydroxybutyrate depolymerase
MIRLTGFDAVADRHGVIGVYPDGVGRSWADGLNTPAERAGVDDVAFIRALIDRVTRQYANDPHRVYAAGMSNGAMMTELLGCRLANRVAAIAPVAGPMPEPLAAGCRPACPGPGPRDPRDR